MTPRTLFAALVLALVAGNRAEAACTISTTAVSFGTYNVYTATADTATGSVTYLCGTADRNIVITLSTGSSGTFTNRTMKKGAETLTYNLYRNAAMTNIWGDGSGSTSTYTRANPPNNSVVLTVYGRIPALQDVSVGNYSDTIIATISF